MDTQQQIKLDQLQNRMGIRFTNQSLLLQAFTHRSYLNEAKNAGLEHNERLEFLGDAVLELVVTEHLYKNFPNQEGELTNWRSAIVKGEVLAKAATDLGLGELLLLSKGEEKSGGRQRGLILANTFEALIGAAYLESGYQPVAKFINQVLISLLPDIIKHKLYIDAKSQLQEVAQEKVSKTPSYRVISEHGPDHSKQFKVGVFVGSTQIAEGEGASKQRAEQAAAANALANWPAAQSSAINR